MATRLMRFLGRILCDLGLHDYRITEKSGGFTAGTGRPYRMVCTRLDDPMGATG